MTFHCVELSQIRVIMPCKVRLFEKHMYVVIYWEGLGECSELVLTKAPLVNFSANKMLDLAEVPVELFEPYLYLTGVTADELCDTYQI